MGTEIERKFRINSRSQIPSEVIHSPCSLITQGYLGPRKDCSVRVRVDEQRGYETKAFITVKGKTKGISRPEFEYPIPVKDACNLLEIASKMELGEGRPNFIIEKSRIRWGRWEIDVFLNENDGLIVAEIELSSEDEIVEIPAWMDEEVTEDHRYANLNLARIPYSLWYMP